MSLDDRDALSRYHPVILLALGMLVRAWLIHAYPLIFGADSVTRLVYHDRIWISHQLPALQASIHYLLRIWDEPILARYWMAAIGAVAGLGFYYVAADLFGRSGAFYAALLFVSNPFILFYSIVPYQEILMLAGLFFAFHFYFAGWATLAGLALGLACLTRYEAWAACPVLALGYVLERRWRPAAFVKALCLFGWAPLAWILYSGGLSPGGTFVVESSVSPARLVRYVYVGWITVKFTPIPVLLLAALGLWRVWRQGMLKGPRFRVLSAFLALFLLAILFSAHGAPRDPERFVSAREAHLPIAAVMALAGLGFYRLPHARLRLLFAAAGFILGLAGSAGHVARETSEPHLQLAYRLARYLDQNVGLGETALLLVEPIPEDQVHAYRDRALRTGGEKGLRKAQQVLEQTATSAPDFQRTLLHSRVAKDRLWTLVSPAVSLPMRQAQLALGAGYPQWIVVWSNFHPADPDESRLYERAIAAGPPVETLQVGELSADIYRIE